MLRKWVGRAGGDERVGWAGRCQHGGSGQLAGDGLVEDLADGEGDDGLAALAEEGVDLAEGVGRLAEGDEEAALLAVEKRPDGVENGAGGRRGGAVDC